MKGKGEGGKGRGWEGKGEERDAEEREERNKCAQPHTRPDTHPPQPPTMHIEDSHKHTHELQQ